MHCALFPYMAHMALSAPNALYGPEDLMRTTLAMILQNQSVATYVRTMVSHRARTMIG